jgi:hypothetical protein
MEQKTETIEKNVLEAFSMNKELFIRQVIFNGANSFLPITFQAEIPINDYEESPYMRNALRNIGSVANLYKTIKSQNNNKTATMQRPANFTSSLTFMNSTYEKMPWFNDVRYNGEELTERLLNISLKSIQIKSGNQMNIYPEKEYFPNELRIKKFWVENEDEIFWKLEHPKSAEVTGDESSYKLIIKANAEESKQLASLVENRYKLLMDLSLGNKVAVRRTTIDDMYD